MSILKERLNQALDSKKNDINSFIWKGEKKEVNGKYVQDEKRLVDCTQQELQRNYDYCWQMLYNSDPLKPGRYLLLDIIDDQINRCNCELFLRWLRSESSKDKFTLVSELRRVINAHKEVIDDLNTLPISSMMSNIPDEFANLPVSLVLEGGSDQLGVFYRKHITTSFVLKQGVWFTSEEIKELTVKDVDTGEAKNRLEVAKENLALRKDIVLRSTPKGLTYTQLKAMITLRNRKYSELTLDQLKTLRNKMLFALSDDCKFHISQWEERMEQILMVAEEKKYMIIIH